MSVGYAGLLLFVLVYCARPEDWTPAATAIPFAKITGFMAVAGFLVSVLLERRGVLHLPREMFFLVLLFGQMCLAIPFALWRGGAFAVVFYQYSKVVLITLVIATTVTSLPLLRRLLFVQAGSIATMAAVSIMGHRGIGGMVFRTGGVVGGIFGNPNDLALSLALTFPLCLALLFSTHHPLKKLIWSFLLVVLGYALMLTYSRSGFLAMAVAVSVCVYEFGLRGRRKYLVALVPIGGLALLLLASPARYGERIVSIVNPAEDWTGSTSSRQDLLKTSLIVTMQHPIFGVGPRNFQVLSGSWHGAHNTYTQVSSEAGIPALILLVLILKRTFFNLRQTQQLLPENEEAQVLARGLRASLFAYVIGAFFSDTAYHFFPYFLIGYASAFYQIACASTAPEPKLSKR